MNPLPPHLTSLGQTWKRQLPAWGARRLHGWLQTILRNLPNDCEALDDVNAKLDRTPVQVELTLRVSQIPPASLPQELKHETAYEPDPRD